MEPPEGFGFPGFLHFWTGSLQGFQKVEPRRMREVGTSGSVGVRRSHAPGYPKRLGASRHLGACLLETAKGA